MKPGAPELASVLAYCLMPNHFHLILAQVSDAGIAVMMSRWVIVTRSTSTNAGSALAHSSRERTRQSPSRLMSNSFTSRATSISILSSITLLRMCSCIHGRHSQPTLVSVSSHGSVEIECLNRFSRQKRTGSLFVSRLTTVVPWQPSSTSRTNTPSDLQPLRLEVFAGGLGLRYTAHEQRREGFESEGSRSRCLWEPWGYPHWLWRRRPVAGSTR